MSNDHFQLEYNALTLKQIGTDPQLTRVALCSALKPNQVLVKMLYSGICGKQLEEITGSGGPDPYIPHLLGHEGSGIVKAVGSDVTHVKPNDLIVIHWITEFESTPYELPKIIDVSTGADLNAGPVTTFSEYTVVLANRVTCIPKETCPRIAALLGCGLTTGLGAVFNEAKICQSDRVLVVGCGGVGLSVIQGCRIVAPETIAAMDISEAALTQASLCGASETIHITNLQNTESFDLSLFNRVFYCIGSTELLSLIHSKLSAPSSVYLVGVPAPNQSITLNARHIHQRKSLHGSYGGLTKPSVDFPVYLDMISRGIIDISLFLSKPYTLHESSQAFEAARSGLGKRVQFTL